MLDNGESRANLRAFSGHCVHARIHRLRFRKRPFSLSQWSVFLDRFRNIAKKPRLLRLLANSNCRKNGHAVVSQQCRRFCFWLSCFFVYRICWVFRVPLVFAPVEHNNQNEGEPIPPCGHFGLRKRKKKERKSEKEGSRGTERRVRRRPAARPLRLRWIACAIVQFAAVGHSVTDVDRYMVRLPRDVPFAVDVIAPPSTALLLLL